MSCGKAIQQLRKESGLTQTELGEKLNVTSQAVSKWENDLSQPDFETIRKMTELFGTTIDEFANLCKEPDEGETTQQAQPTKHTEEKEERKEMLGVCTVCGKAIYENNVGEENPFVCSDCHEAKEREKAAKEAEKKARTASTVKKALITPAVIIGIIIAIFIPVGIANGLEFYIVISGVAGLLLIYLPIPQIIWDDGIVADIFETICLKTFEMPGIIFEWDWDGLKFLILMKLVFALLSFFLSVAAFLFGMILCMIVAPFTFIPQVIKAKNGEFTD